MLIKKLTPLFFAISTYWSALLVFVRDVLLMNLLSPYQLGLWRIILTFQANAKYISLGLPGLLIYRGLPLGLVDKYTKEILPLIVLSFVILAPLYTIIAGVYVLEHEFSFITICSLLLVVFFVVSTNVITSIYIANKDFRGLIFLQAVTPIVVLGFVSRLNEPTIIDLLLPLLAGGAISLLLYSKSVWKSITLSFYKKRKDIFSPSKLTIFTQVSLKSMSPPLLFSLYQGSEIVLFNTFVGTAAVGLLSVVLTFNAMACMASTSITTFINSHNAKKIKHNINYLHRVNLVNFLMTGLVCIIGYFLLIQFIPEYFVEYTGALKFLDVYIYCIPFLALRNASITNIIANRREVVFSLIICSLLFVKISAFWCFYAESGLFILMFSNVLFGVACILYTQYISRS